ncbi:VTC domain-containing protein [Propionimicrobium sp. PCR01-08-3]|uniref:VTC domain-containing protein n=1 Tax=Propionimicrobium sp. PCR01-08-3 TaxID=3052086 RepID=UPI00255C8E7D|nr:VTC domain-containing protein [Propionimicrobium sp. PCR01-08-3]WIY81745.1 VTC domain-containing protein [Propionimicrobium sp. PCR01-08-3]
MRQTISLDELNAQSNMLTRVDRKYLMPTSELPAFFRSLEYCSRILEINGLTWFGYHSVYYDTPDLRSYADAGTGRRRRFKVRTRDYLSSGDHWLEVKTRGPRKTTVKDRVPLAGSSETISSSNRHWIADTLSFRNIPGTPVATMRPALTTNYSRRTLQIRSANGELSRMTVDVGLQFMMPDDSAALTLDDYAIVETKGSPRPAPSDRLLWSIGHRPQQMSKFGVGLALLNPQLPAFKWNRIIRREFAGRMGSGVEPLLSSRAQ